MDISAQEKNEYKPLIMRVILGFFLGLIGFFTLTEEDRLEAGIFTDTRWN